MYWEFKKFLYDKGISQKDLAISVNVSQVMISNVISGKRKLSKRLSKAISEYLGITENELKILFEERG